MPTTTFLLPDDTRDIVRIVAYTMMAHSVYSLKGWMRYKRDVQPFDMTCGEESCRCMRLPLVRLRGLSKNGYTGKIHVQTCASPALSHGCRVTIVSSRVMQVRDTQPRAYVGQRPHLVLEWRDFCAQCEWIQHLNQFLHDEHLQSVGAVVPRVLSVVA